MQNKLIAVPKNHTEVSGVNETVQGFLWEEKLHDWIETGEEGRSVTLFHN